MVSIVIYTHTEINHSLSRANCQLPFANRKRADPEDSRKCAYDNNLAYLFSEMLAVFIASIAHSYVLLSFLS